MTDFATKQELKEAKEALNARITKVVSTVAALSIVVGGLVAWQASSGGSIDTTGSTGSSTSVSTTTTTTVETPPAEAPAGELLFSTDFASWSGWYMQCLPGRATLVNGWARFEVRPGDQDPDTKKSRCEVSGPDYKEGTTLWIRDVFRRGEGDTSTPGDWLLVQQLHEDNWSGSPANGVLYTSDWSGRLGNQITYDSLPVLARGVTNELLYKIKLSQNANGEVEAFWNGVSLPVYRGKTLFAPFTYLKVGIYRASASSGTSVIEHDLVRIGTTRAAVMG